IRTWPYQVTGSRDALGECSPLHIAHNALSIAGSSPTELPSRNQRGLGRSGIATSGSHNICEVDPTRLYLDQILCWSGHRIGNLPQFQHLRIAKSTDDNGFHGRSVAVR